MYTSDIIWLRVHVYMCDESQSTIHGIDQTYIQLKMISSQLVGCRSSVGTPESSKKWHVIINREEPSMATIGHSPYVALLFVASRGS